VVVLFICSNVYQKAWAVVDDEMVFVGLAAEAGAAIPTANAATMTNIPNVRIVPPPKMACETGVAGA
jgi:hypothetical protein